MTAFIFLGNSNLNITRADLLADQDRAAEKVEREYIIPKLKRPSRNAIVAYAQEHPGEVARLISEELIAMGHRSWVLGGEKVPGEQRVEEEAQP